MSRLGLLGGFSLILVLSSCAGLGVPPASGLDAIIVDMPHGWWRIHVYPDGSAAYGFGALPEMGSVEKSTFDFEAVHAELRRRIAGDREDLQEYGTVQFCSEGEGCGELFYIDDGVYVQTLLNRAFENRTGESTLGVGGTTDTIDHLWRERK